MNRPIPIAYGSFTAYYKFDTLYLENVNLFSRPDHWNISPTHMYVYIVAETFINICRIYSTVVFRGGDIPLVLYMNPC